MPNNGVIIYQGTNADGTPIGINSDDVLAVTKYNSHDWAHFCRTPLINPFAMFKPVRIDQPQDITIAQRQAVSFGIALGYIAEAKSAAVNLTEQQQSTLPTVPNWTYAPPILGQHFFRITDFLNNENPKQPGYNHRAKPPISGFSDITVFQSEFGSNSKFYSFNFKYGSASNQGVNDTSGIEIPITMLRSDITDGNWRFGLLIFFPSGNKFIVGIASSNSAISDSATRGDMMIRPAMTGRLNELYTNAYNAGVRELDAIPILGYRLNRTANATGSQDRFMFDADSKIISMPRGEKIKIKLSSRFANVSLTLNSITIKYLDKPGNVKATYTLTPTDASSGMHKTTFAAPSTYGAVRCQIEVDITTSGSMASGDSIAKNLIKIGIESILVNTAVSTLEAYTGSSWTSVPAITSLGGRYRFVATDAQNTSSDDRSSIMNYFESLPRRSSYSADLTIHPALSLDGSLFNTSNYIIHHG